MLGTEQFQTMQNAYMAPFSLSGSLMFTIALTVLVIIVLMLNIRQRQAAQTRLRRHNDYLELMHQTALALMNRLDLEELLEDIVKRSGKIIGTEHVFAYLVSEDESYLEMKVATNAIRSGRGTRLQPGEGVAGQVWQKGEPLLIMDYAQWEGRSHNPVFDAAASVIGIPLKSMGKIVGVVGLLHTSMDKEFGPEEVFFLSRFAELASLAVDNARLHQAACLELTERKKMDQARRQEEVKLRSILSAIPDQIVRFSSDGYCLEVMAAHGDLPTQPVKELCGLTVEEIYPPEVARLYRQSIQALEASGRPQIFEYQLEAAAAIDCEARLVASAQDEILVIVRDVTERKKIEAQFQYISLHDPLTGLYNRAYFQQEMRRLANGRQLPVGIVVCDVDGLKLINDTLGHEHGDTLIIAVARILTECFRDNDVVARIGGDEFAILMPRINPLDLERVRRHIQDREAAYNQRNPGIPLGLSVGYAASDGDSVNMDALFQKADNAMYRHKLMAGRDIRTTIVKGMLKALERCDFFDYDHARRLQSFVGIIGDRLQLRKSQRKNLHLLAQFHDIGKIGISDEILYKPAPLTAEEFNEISRHCEIGYRIARSIPELTGIADWVLKHHEFWDGSGYPLGLKGEAIPLESRILAVADAYEVMTADRPYRQALTKREAVAELQARAGIQFDPKLVEVFVAVVAEMDP